MSTTNNFTDFHLRGFVIETGQDPTRPGYDSALQLKENINIPAVQGEELSDDSVYLRWFGFLPGVVLRTGLSLACLYTLSEYKLNTLRRLQPRNKPN